MYVYIHNVGIKTLSFPTHATPVPSCETVMNICTHTTVWTGIINSIHLPTVFVQGGG